MLKADKIRYENGVKICEKIIPNYAKATKYISSWVPKGGKMKPGGKMNPIGITIHNTEDLDNVYEDSEQYTRATYPNGNMNGVVVHYYVDDVSAWQNLREDEPGWHAADGGGDGNMRTIAIECVMDGSGSKEDLGARDNAARLIASIMIRHNWDLDNLYTHNHWMGLPDKIVSGVRKNCPIYILPKYSEFKSLVQKYLNEFKGSVNTKPDVSNKVNNLNEIPKDSSTSSRYSDISVDDILNFTGTKQYRSTDSKSSATTAKPSKVKVTLKSKAETAHPIHVRSVDDQGNFISGVYGWVNISDLKPIANTPFLAKVTSKELNIRKGPGTSYGITNVIRDEGTYTIVEVNNGWGLLKAYQRSRNGWIRLSYTKKI